MAVVWPGEYHSQMNKKIFRIAGRAALLSVATFFTAFRGCNSEQRKLPYVSAPPAVTSPAAPATIVRV